MPASHTTELFGLIVENIGGGELLVILLLALVVLGPDRIPEMAKGAGRLIH
ncbi:MAG: twin-arginine translocase TatA/TatE family subunit, partial [Microthrixaceae bacterium]|nr:twin-arginine translocase TatA/TatE family subunit [Microthrixaceae bacterium]